jgi:hypothetical protein
MKKQFTLIFLLTIASICTFGQNQQDQTQILQKCIDLPLLQQYFPKDSDGNYKAVVILQHGVSFPLNTTISKFGKSIQFMDKSQLSNLGINSFFLFWEFKIELNSAKVNFAYNYITTNNQPMIKKVSLVLQKANNLWIVSETKTEGE